MSGGKNALSDFIEGLRANLEIAHQAGEGRAVRFAIDEIELDLEVATTGEAGGEGGIKFWIVNLGADAKMKDEVTQKIHMKMRVVGDQGKEVFLMSADDARRIGSIPLATGSVKSDG